MQLQVLFVLLSAVHMANSLFGIGFKQVVAVKGRLMCNGRPAAGVLIKMYDSDFTLDSKMGQTTSDSEGEFHLVGEGREISTIDPKVNFYHDCENNVLRCKRKLVVKIPDSYVTSGSVPQNTYNFQNLELAGKFKGESHDCVHRR